MFGVSESYAALCLIVFVVGSAAACWCGGIFADRVRRHDRVAAVGLLVAAALTRADRDADASRRRCCRSWRCAGFAGGTTNPRAT